MKIIDKVDTITIDHPLVYIRKKDRDKETKSMSVKKDIEDWENKNKGE